MLTFLIAFFSLISLLILHEFGHFILAKKFGVMVEEFGIFYPPRIFAKKIGRTLYSLNLLPLGAFVKIHETKNEKDSRAFGAKPFWQRALIILGGVLSFWLISALLFSIVMGLGFSQAVTDEANENLTDIKVQILGVMPNSPAEEVRLKIGDAITKVKTPASARATAGRQNSKVKNINKVGQVTEFIQAHKGEEVILTIQRGKEVFDVALIPRLSPPEEEGPMGVVLARTAQKKYPLIEAPFQGILAALKTTYFALESWGIALKNLFLGVPTGVELTGPVGIFSLLSQAASYSTSYFLQFVATISIYIALCNALPIPMADGGKMLFLFIEELRGKKIPEKVENRINSAFLVLLIALMILITIKDIQKIF